MKKTILGILALGAIFSVNAQNWVIPGNGTAVGTTYIGTSNSPGSPLRIATLSASNDVRFYIGGSADANEKMRLASNGNFGIGTGTTVPGSKLTVAGTFSVTGANATSLGGTLNTTGATTLGSTLAVTGGTTLNNNLRLETGTFSMNGASKFDIDGPGILGGRFSVSSTGKVGVNNPNPAELLSLSGGDILIQETTDYSKMPDGGAADIYLKDNSGGSVNIYSYGDGHYGGISLNSGVTPGTATEFRINGTGNSTDLKTSVTFFADGRMAIGAKDDGNHMARPTGYRLFVKEGILTEGLKIASANGLEWSDFVFADDYKLNTLDSVANYIKTNKHLPDVPSASEVTKNGIDVAKMDATLLQKIEEMTLYLIEMNKKLGKVEEENKILKKEIDTLKKY